MWRYLFRKVSIYVVTFVVAVTIDWAIPRFMPGDPVERLLSRMQAQPQASEELTGFYTKAFGFDVPLWKQYLNFWAALFHGDLGRSITNFPTPVSELIMGALPYTLALLVPADPAQLLGGEQGRRARRPQKDARQHRAPGGLRADRDPADVARDHPRLAVRLDPRPLPRLGRVRPRAAAGVVARVRARASSTTGSCRSPPSSSSPSAAGRSGCGT